MIQRKNFNNVRYDFSEALYRILIDSMIVACFLKVLELFPKTPQKLRCWHPSTALVQASAGRMGPRHMNIFPEMDLSVEIKNRRNSGNQMVQGFYSDGDKYFCPLVTRGKSTSHTDLMSMTRNTSRLFSIR
jgi:hypothetical protein